MPNRLVVLAFAILLCSNISTWQVSSIASAPTLQLVTDGVFFVRVILSLLHLNILHVRAQHIMSIIRLKHSIQLHMEDVDAGMTNLDLLPRSLVQRLPKLLRELLLESIKPVLRLEV